MEKESNKKQHSYLDIVNMTSTQYASAFGPHADSLKPTSAAYSFGKSTRQANAKLFVNNELAALSLAEGGPGPATFYSSESSVDKMRFKNSPAVKLAPRDQFLRREGKHDIDRPKYQYYNLPKEMDQIIDVGTSDKMRRQSSASTIFGAELRFPRPKIVRGTPGPQYNLECRLKRTPSFTFGFRRGVKDAQTPQDNPQVGPANYPSNIYNTFFRSMGHGAKITFGKQKKQGLGKRVFDDTHDSRKQYCNQQDYNGPLRLQLRRREGPDPRRDYQARASCGLPSVEKQDAFVYFRAVIQGVKTASVQKLDEPAVTINQSGTPQILTQMDVRLY